MPRNLESFSDGRMEVWCPQCGESKQSVVLNRDHVPSKVLLDKPYPEGLGTVRICKLCNDAFSKDEEYVSAALSAWISDSADPKRQAFSAGQRVLARSPALRSRIQKQRVEQGFWDLESDRIERVVIKQARNHAIYEGGEYHAEKPEHVAVVPLDQLSVEQRSSFLDSKEVDVWPEVGSRWMARLVEDTPAANRLDRFDEYGFLIVQEHTYRFRLDLSAGLSVKSIIYGALATEVIWR